MALRGRPWDATIGPAGLGDRPLLEALEVAFPDAAVGAAIEATGTRERRVVSRPIRSPTASRPAPRSRRSHQRLAVKDAAPTGQRTEEACCKSSP
jgi:hypothetical protein